LSPLPDSDYRPAPLRWSLVDRCILWLGMQLALFSFYLNRCSVLLADAALEPYFDRGFLAILRWGLVLVIGVLCGLLAYAVFVRSRSPVPSWLVHVSIQIWWVFMALCAYALGPTTTPILGLLVLGGYLSILLFPRRVVGPAVAVGMTILSASSYAEWHGWLPHSPLFADRFDFGGNIPAAYFIGTATVSYTLMTASFILASYMVERGRKRETALRQTSAALGRAHESLEHRIDERTAALSVMNAELEHLYSHAPVGLGQFDSELRYVRINERLAEINGHPVAAHFGRRIDEMVPGVAEICAPIMRRVYETGEPALDIEVRGDTPADPGAERYWLTSYYRAETQDGEPLGINVVVQDISELKWAQENAQHHLESLAHVSRVATMGQMAAGIAHELNQPLAAIANYANAGRILLDKADDESISNLRDVFGELSALALRAGRIIRRLRAFVKKAAPERTTASMRAILDDVLGLVGAELRARGIAPEVRVDPDLPEVRADVIQIEQVLINLVRNASDALVTKGDGDRAVTISVRRSGVFAEIEVCDSGVGLDDDDHDRIFDAFYTTKNDGMGMGLAISRSIVEDHGGRLWAVPNETGGLSMHFTVPLASEKKSDAA